MTLLASFNFDYFLKFVDLYIGDLKVHYDVKVNYIFAVDTNHKPLLQQEADNFC